MSKPILVMVCSLLVMPLIIQITWTTPAQAKTKDVFQAEAKSKPFKVVVNLDYSHKQLKEGVGKISVYYEDSDGFKKTKVYDFDEMMKRAWPDHVKVKAKFPRNTASHFEDYLICVTTLKDNHDTCINESRSPGTNKERVHIQIP